MGHVLWTLELCISRSIGEFYMQGKKKNTIIISIVCIVGMVVIGIALYIIINNSTYRTLDIKYESTAKYTITSGSTGNVYDISKEECNNIIEKLNDTKVKQKDFEPTQGWSSYITFSDENGISHRMEVCKDRIEYDYVWYAVKKDNSALYDYVKTLENKYFK